MASLHYGDAPLHYLVGFFSRHWLGIMVSLYSSTANINEFDCLVLILNAFGNNLDSQRLPQAHNQIDNGIGALKAADLIDERLIDLGRCLWDTGLCS
jgi:hypothetical protein